MLGGILHDIGLGLLAHRLRPLFQRHPTLLRCILFVCVAHIGLQTFIQFRENDLLIHWQPKILPLAREHMSYQSSQMGCVHTHYMPISR